MKVEQAKKVDLLNIVSRFWRVVGFLSILPAGTIFVFFDSPSPNWNANNFFLYSVISFPLVCYATSFGIPFLMDKYQKLAVYVAMLPVVPLILIYVGSNWMSESRLTMQNQGNAIAAAKCESPVVDGGDALETTGCGLLESDIPVTGTINNISEAQNWQFSYQFSSPNKTGGITIHIETDGKACPEIRILGVDGVVIEGHTVGYDLGQCSERLFQFEFNPSNDGTYILRVFTPTTPGTYWLRIHKH